MAYSGTDEDLITVGRQFALEVGGNETTVTVTAANGTPKTYTVTVGRAASSDASLSELTVNDMEIEAGADGNYAANVAIDITMATIVATATSEEATVAYSGEDADPATDGHQVDLDVGDNEITVTVAAGDETQAEYMVTVTRAVPSSDASLSELTVNGMAVDADADGNYAAEVANDVTMATIVATATDADGATVAYSGEDADLTTDGHQVALEVGDTEITVTVTAADETKAEYTVTVTQAEPSDDASLSELTVNGMAVDADADGDYAAVVANDVTMATIVATATDADGATVAYSGEDADLTTDGHQVALEVGDTEITVTVTAADETKAEYTVTVTRGTVLSELTVNGTEIDASADGSYATTVSYDIVVASIIATASDPGARVIYSGAQDTDAAAEGLQFALDVGANEITVVVIASDGQTTETLVVTVTRGQAQVTLVVTPNPVGEDGGPATVTATVDPAAPADFTVEVASMVTSEGHAAEAAVLSATMRHYRLTKEKRKAPGR